MKCSGLSLCAGLLMVSLPLQDALAAHAMDAMVAEDGRGSVITVRGQLGLLNGEARELVYGGAEAAGNEDYKVSELIWDLESVMMAGAVVTIGGGGRLVLNAGLWKGINEGVDGEMWDYDWMDPARPDWTDRSRSEVDVIDAMMFDINLSLAVAVGEGYSLAAVGGLMVDIWEWDDRGQEFTYTVNSFRDTRGNFDGQNVIDYQQTFLIPYIGVEAAADLDGISIQGWLLYSSVVVAEDQDHHILRDIHFTETFDGGDYIAYGVAATLNIGEVLFVQGSVEKQEVKEIIGDMEIEETGTSNEDGAGISHEATMISAAIGIRL